jgi:hypothetical protein
MKEHSKLSICGRKVKPASGCFDLSPLRSFVSLRWEVWMDTSALCKRNRRIGLDLDGVIIDHTASKIRLVAEHGLRLEPWQTNTNIFGRLIGREVYRAIEGRLYGELTESSAPVAGALEHLALLPDDTCIVSARNEISRGPAQRWLELHGVTSVIAPERIIFVGSGEEKLPELLRLGITDYLDDKLSVLRGLPSDIGRVLFDEYRLSSKLDLPTDVVVVTSWVDFISSLRT